MKIKFELKDETTVTNTTVKITTWITGQVGDDERPALEARARSLADQFLNGKRWAFSDFSYQNNGMTFRVQASTRIDSTENDQLEEKARKVSDRRTAIQLSNADPSIPTYEIRAAESRLRLKLLQLAQEEGTKLGGVVTEVDFTDPETVSLSHRGGARMATANYSYEAAGAALGSSPLGHSEKILLSAIIEVDSSPAAVAAAAAAEKPEAVAA